MIRWIDNIVLLDNHVESNGEIYLYCSFETSRRHGVKYICKRVRLTVNAKHIRGVPVRRDAV